VAPTLLAKSQLSRSVLAMRTPPTQRFPQR
jgi:hypothetical protein